MNIPKESELDNIHKWSGPYIQKHYPKFYKYINDNYSCNKFSGKLYLYFNKLEHPTCPTCNAPVPFLSIGRGFQRYCSSKCSNSNPEFQSKRQKTCLEKYGASSPCQNEQVKKKLVSTYVANNGGMGNASKTVKDKQFKTMKELYGSEHALQNKELMQKNIDTQIERYGGVGMASDINKTKALATNLERYGSEQVWSSMEIRKKIAETNLKKYGAIYATQNTEVAQKVSKSKQKQFVDYHNDIISSEKDKDGTIYYTCKCPHPECKKCEHKTYVIQAERYCNRRLDGTEPCTNILPVIKGRIKNTFPELFVKDIITECVPEQELLLNNRTVITPKELDIYDPLRGLAFECNGCYWHSRKDHVYHNQKYKLCKEQGIQLLTIWEDWIKTKPEIVKSIIKSKYHHYNEVIYGRNCRIEKLDPAIAKEFLDVNHIQGRTAAHVHFGLLYNDRLVAVMSFSKMRGCMGSQTSREGQWELVRYCSLLNTKITGGAGKLLKHFIKTYKPESVVSFSSNDISNGALYKSLGFEESGENSSYWYIGNDYKRFHRSSFTKSEIIRKGLAPDKEHWTETEAMLMHGYVKIYDTGQTKWILKIKESN